MIRFEFFKEIQDQKQLVELSDTLHICDQDLYDKYLIKPVELWGWGAFPYAGCDSYELESESNYRYKFIEIKFDDDTVALFYKVYNMYGKAGSYLWIKPISLNNNYIHEKLVFQHLVDGKLINVILLPEVIPNIDFKDLFIRNDEYYCNTEDRVAEISKSKYRSAKGINKLKNSYNIITKVNDYDPVELQNIRYYWWKLHKKQNNPFDKAIDNLLKVNNGKIWTLTFEMNNEVLGFTIITSYFNNKAVRIIQNTNLLNTEIDKYDDFVNAHLADYMHYETMQFINSLHIPYTYIGDAHGAGKFLAPYKARNFKLHVFNHDLPIERYKELYKEGE